MDRQTIKTINTRPGKFTRFLRRLAWFFLVYLPPARDVQVLTRNGLLSFNSKDKTTGRNLYIHRNHEFDEMMQYVALLRNEGFLSPSREGAVLDVGGYVGMSSCAFLLEDIFDKAVAFEPSPENFRLLQKNIQANGLAGRLLAHNMALSDADGELSFELSTKNYGDHRVRKSGDIEAGFFNEQDRQVIQVQARSFDSLDATALGVDPSQIRLVWMDIQGHEGKFLRGARQFFKTYPRVPVIMEFWPYAIKRSGMSRDEFIALVTELFNGYYVDTFPGHEFHSIASIGEYFDSLDHPQAGSSVVLVNR